MDATYWLAPLKFIIDTLSTLYSGAILLRLLLQWVKADYYNPICQFVVKITHPLLRPLRRAVPSVGRFDLASLVLLLILQILTMLLLASLPGVTLPGLFGIPVLAIMRALELFFDLYVGIILGSALLSWISPHSNSPVASLLYSLSDPLLEIARRRMPDLGGLDLSPLVVLMVLELARMMLMPILQQLFRLLN
ncbi:MAG: YggT family protein [Methylococcaceae bacterium]|nr:MAG: YggT family protein [Methylococcaceae bacterium]